MDKFIVAFGLALVLGAPASGQTVPWKVEVVRDQMDDSVQYVANAYADGPLSRESARLALFCSANGPVNLQYGAGLPMGWFTHEFRIRIDKNDARTLTGKIFPQKGLSEVVVVHRVGGNIIREMRQGGSILLHSNDNYIRFTLSGVTWATNWLSSRCEMPVGWKDGK